MRHCTQCGAATPDDARFCPRCGAPVAAAGGSDPMLGKVIADRYLLVEKVGQGGSGTIYRGEHTTLRKRVAVKVLHAQLTTDDTALERFRREATTVAELDNDHILQVLDFGRTEDNRLFFAMEHLEGETLTKVIERERMLPIERALDILGQIAEALTEAHGLGYVHRDLRPRNIFLINKRGRADFVKLLDFGLAKLILPNMEAKQTAMGMTFGDPRYMSPEQARGEALDRRSDIYSLGAIAFEMLTGTPPYTGSGTFEILQQHLDAPVPRVRVLRPDCPEWLDAVVQRALAKQPDGRFSTVSKLLESLKEQQSPGALDLAEKAAHANLSAERPAPAPAPGPVQSMGPAAAVEQLPAKPGSPRDTLALTTLGPKNAPQAAAKAKANKQEKERNNGGGPGGPAATSGSVEVVRAPLKAPDAAANVPSVVVESSSQEKTMPAKIPAAEAAAIAPADRPTVERPTAMPTPVPVTKAGATPTPTHGTEAAQRRQKDPTGEWFSSDSQPIRIVPGATYDDDLDELPKKHKGPVIIAGVTGGLIFVGIIVIALLPKPQHKPLRGEEATKSGVVKGPPPATNVQPSGSVATGSAQPSGAASVGGTGVASGTAAGPSGSSGVTGIASGSAAPSGAASSTAIAPAASGTNAARAPGSAAAPSAPVAVSGNHGGGGAASGAAVAPVVAAPAVGAGPKAASGAAVGAAPVSKPAAKPVVAVAVKPNGAAAAAKPSVAKPTVASEKGGAPSGGPGAREAKGDKVEKAAGRVAMADKGAGAARKKEKAEAFKDPFAPDAPKASAPSASESAQAEFFVKLGRQKLSAGDVGGAATNFNKAREYDARSADAVAGIGEVAFEQGDYAGAAVHLKQALRLSPNRSRYLVLLGQAYYKLGKPKDAVGEYKKALRIDPNNQEAQHSLEVAERKLQSGG